MNVRVAGIVVNESAVDDSQSSRTSSSNDDSEGAEFGCEVSAQPHWQSVAWFVSLWSSRWLSQQLEDILFAQHALASLRSPPQQQQLPLDFDSAEHEQLTPAQRIVGNAVLPNSCVNRTAKSRM